MLTFRTAGYKDEQLFAMRDALSAAYDEIMSCGQCRNCDHYDCTTCTMKYPCADIARVLAYVETELIDK